MSKIKPTAAELEILTYLWKHGPSSVREVHSQLSQMRDVYYTTTLKTMQVMFTKKLVLRDTSERAHIYSPSVKKSDIERSLIDGLRTSMFSGSPASLVMSALGHDRPTPEELEEIRALLDKMEDHDDV
jgi:predicted transcriptional regulator